MKHLLLALVLVSLTAHADSDFFAQELTACSAKNCQTNQIIYEFNPEANVGLQFGFNVVHWGGARGTRLYPLFQVYNHNKTAIAVVIGVQLLDANKSLLLEISQNSEFKPTTRTKPSYESYLSVNAKPVSGEILKQTRFMRVVYRRNGSRNGPG
jgi:hypothetical protein